MSEVLAAFFDVTAAERLARLRSLRLAVRLLCGPAARELEQALSAAEQGDGESMDRALHLIEHLPALSRRRVLGSWASTLRGPVAVAATTRR